MNPFFCLHSFAYLKQTWHCLFRHPPRIDGTICRSRVVFYSQGMPNIFKEP